MAPGIQAVRNTLHLPPLPTVRDILKTYRLRATKHLAQNFIVDPRVCRRVVAAAGDLEGSYVCEVGPGPGNLTRYILEHGARKVVVVEKDRRFLPTLQHLSEVSGNRVRIIHGDILRFDMHQAFPKSLTRGWDEEPPNIHIIGNLPFNVSTPLIIRWLEDIAKKKGAFAYGRVKLTLCFQLEVAERIVALETTSQRCRLSATCQNWCRVKHKMTIPRDKFVPRPEVQSGVVHFTPRKTPLIPLPFKLVVKVFTHIFHYRRKRYKKGLADLFPPELRVDLVSRVLERTGIPEHRLAYSLDMTELRMICEEYDAICQEMPDVRAYYFRHSIDPFTDTHAVDLDTHAVDLDAYTVDLDADTVGLDADAEGLDADAEDLDADTVDLDADTVDLDADAEGLDADTVDLDADAVDLDADAEDLDADTEGLDADAEGLDADAVDLDAGTVDLDAGTVGLDAGTVGLDAGTEDLDTGSDSCSDANLK